MLNYLKKILLGESLDGSTKSQHTEEKKLQIATCALLLETAKIDDDFSEDELKQIVEILKSNFQLNKAEINELLELAENRVDESVSIYEFTEIINQHFNNDQKFSILKNLWQLVYADDYLDSHEEYLMRKISNNLHLSHKDMITAKMMAKDN